MKVLRNALIAATAIAAISTAATEVVAQSELRIDRTRDMTSLDSALFTDIRSQWAVIDAIYSGLVQFKLGSWDIEADLAESWEISDDGLTITFKIKEGIQFHRGYGEVTSEDVKFSFERIIDPALDSLWAVK